MLSFTALNKHTKKSLEFSAFFLESSITWSIKTTVDYIDYKIVDFIFHHNIRFPKAVAKMFDLCRDSIVYEINDEKIRLSIDVDYIDSEPIVCELEKVVQDYEKILMKHVYSLEERIVNLEEENKRLSEVYTAKSLEGSYMVEIDENTNKLTYSCYCSIPSRQKEFEERILNSFKSANIYALVYLCGQYAQYISETSRDRLRRTIKKIAKCTSIQEIWEIVSDFKISPKNQTTWTLNNKQGQQISQMSVSEYSLFFQIPVNNIGGMLDMNMAVNHGTSYNWYSGGCTGKSGTYWGGSITGNCTLYEHTKQTVFMFRKVKFAFEKITQPREIKKLNGECTSHIRYIAGCSNVVYDTFGDLYEEIFIDGKNNELKYIYDI